MKRLTAILLMTLLLAGAALPACAAAMPAFTTNERLPDAMVGIYYSTRVEGVAHGPLEFSLPSNPYGNYALPKGLSLQKNGQIYGTPKTAGDYEFVVQAKIAYVTATQVFRIRVKPFSEDALNPGGSNARIMGSGNDDITGVANGPNGGRVTMHGDVAFFIDGKNFLRESDEPFKKSALSYKASGYAWLDVLENDLYYYHHYLAQKGDPLLSITDAAGVQITPGKKTYVTRIVQDSVRRKGRNTLVVLKKPIMDLSVTETLVMYLQNDAMLRASLDSGKPLLMRAYAGGQELKVEHAFPFNGYAYFSGTGGGLYRMPLDGQVAQKLTEKKVGAFTAGVMDGGYVMVFADQNKALHLMPLEGGEAGVLEGLSASALNTDDQYIYFANAADKNRIYRFRAGSGEAPERLSEMSAKSLYLFHNYLAFEDAGSKALYIMPKAGGEAVRLTK